MAKTPVAQSDVLVAEELVQWARRARLEALDLVRTVEREKPQQQREMTEALKRIVGELEDVVARHTPVSPRSADLSRPYTIAKLAERWRCSEHHVRQLIASGELRAFRIGAKLWRVPAAEVEDFERRKR